MAGSYLFAVLTHHGADPRRPQLLPAQQASGHPVPTSRLLHVVQTVDQTPVAGTEEDTVCEDKVCLAFIDTHTRHD